MIVITVGAVMLSLNSLVVRFVFYGNVQVFMQAFIPRKLDDVVDFERDLERVREGIDTDLVCRQFYL